MANGSQMGKTMILMLVNSLMTKEVDLENILGSMEIIIKVNG
jgi:hypothetical protein